MSKMDLIPGDIHFLITWNYRRIVLIALLPLILGVSILWRIQVSKMSELKIELTIKAEEIEKIESMQKEASELLNKLKLISEEKENISRTALLLSEYLDSTAGWYGFFADLFSRRYFQLWLNKISLQEIKKRDSSGNEHIARQVKIGGRCADLRELVKLVGFLESHPMLENVVLYQNERGILGGKDFYSFLIVGEVRE